MIGKIILSSTTFIVSATLSLTLSIAVCADAAAQTRQAQPMKLQAASVSPAEITRFCGSGSAKASKRGRTTTYSCEPRPSGSTMSSVQAHPDVQRSEINCSYSESGGVTKWLGCTCKENDEGNCNHFITNCIENGDTVEGNSGGASCGPSGG